MNSFSKMPSLPRSGMKRDLRRRHPLDVADLLLEGFPIRQAQDVDLVGLPLFRDLVGQVGVDVGDREAAPGADAEPIRRMEHQLTADHHRPRELVLQRHRRVQLDLEAQVGMEEEPVPEEALPRVGAEGHPADVA
jgi:hypothetical protein